MYFYIFMICALLFFILSPGVLFEFQTTMSKYSIAFIHALCFGVSFVTAFEYYKHHFLQETMEDDTNDNESPTSLPNLSKREKIKQIKKECEDKRVRCKATGKTCIRRYRKCVRTGKDDLKKTLKNNTKTQNADELLN